MRQAILIAVAFMTAIPLLLPQPLSAEILRCFAQTELSKNSVQKLRVDIVLPGDEAPPSALALVDPNKGGGSGEIISDLSRPIRSGVIEISWKIGSDFDKPKREKLFVVMRPVGGWNLVGFFLRAGSNYPVTIKADLWTKDRLSR